MRLSPAAAPPRDVIDLPDLARGWYVAASSDEATRRPRLVLLAGREYVVWRARHGQVSVMERFCPHQGAALELGRVEGDSLRCAFHHWRFAPDGECVAAPSTRRVPSDASAAVLPVWEGLGLVWVWLGSGRAEQPPPRFAPMKPGSPRHRRYSFSFRARATPRRVLENGFDVPHFAVVHAIPADLELTWEPAEAHMLSARLSAHQMRLPAPFDRWLRIGRLDLRLTSTASYQALTFELGGEPVAHELLALTPVEADVTLMRGWTVMPRSSTLLGSAAAFWGYRWQHWRGTQEDLRIYDHAVDVGSTVNTPDDEGVLRFRQFYRRWAAE